MIRDAREVFKAPEFSEEEIARVFEAAGGLTLHFGRGKGTNEHGLARTDTDGGMGAALVSYARGEKWRAGLSVSVRRFYQVLAAVRKDFCRERVLAFQQEGLSLRQLARLYERSVPTIQAKMEERGVRSEEARCSE